MRIKDQPKIVEVLVAEDVGCDVPEAIDILAESIEELLLQISVLPDWNEHNNEVHRYREVQLEELEEATSQHLPRVLRSSRLKRPRVSTTSPMKLKNVPIKEITPEVETVDGPNPACQVRYTLYIRTGVKVHRGETNLGNQKVF